MQVDNKTNPRLESYQKSVNLWNDLRQEKTSIKLCQKITKISKSTYFRYKRKICVYKSDAQLPSKRPKNVNKPKWGAFEQEKIVQIRKQNPTYGKAKICVILRRDFGLAISESTVGRILSMLLR